MCLFNKETKKKPGVTPWFKRILTAEVKVLIHWHSVAPRQTVAYVGREKFGFGSF